MFGYIVNEFLDALPVRLGRKPKFEIFGSIIVAHAIDVMDIFPSN